jgi:protein phosphatase PTC7
MVPHRLGLSGISCDVAPRLAEHESTTEHESPAEHGHCEADRIPTDIARNRPHDASELSCSRWGLWRKSALLAAAVLGVSMPTGVTGDVASVQQAPFMAYAAHASSPVRSADNHVHDLRPLHAKNDKTNPTDYHAMPKPTLKWPDALASPVSEPESLSRNTGVPGLRDITFKGFEASTTTTLDLELLSEEADAQVEEEIAVDKNVAPQPLLGLDIGWSSIPHPLKVQRGGEDSHIIARLHGATLIGVFDGVGGWAELGIDPAEYARKLGRLVEAALANNPAVLKEEQPLMTMLTEAFEVLQAEDLAGSCTASLALLTEDAKLHVLNVGDSGIHILRNGQCIFQTGDQQHYFNCPYQLGMGSDDRPADAGYFVLEDLEPGDVIVAATDGVWDNLHQVDMLKMVSAANSKDSLVAPPSTSEVASQWSPEVLARAISEASHLHGKDDKFVRYTHSIYV